MVSSAVEKRKSEKRDGDSWSGWEVGSSPLWRVTVEQRGARGGMWMSAGKASGGGVSEGKAWHVLEQRGQSGRSRASEGMHGGGLGGLQELLKMTYPRRDGPHERVLSMRVK